MIVKTVASFTSLIEAQIVRSKLQSCGLDARIPDEHILSMGHGASLRPDGSIIVQVEDEQWDEARQILEADNALESDLALKREGEHTKDTFAGDPRPGPRKNFWKKAAITAVGIAAIAAGIVVFRRRNRKDYRVATALNNDQPVPAALESEECVSHRWRGHRNPHPPPESHGVSPSLPAPGLPPWLGGRTSMVLGWASWGRAGQGRGKALGNRRVVDPSRRPMAW